MEAVYLCGLAEIGRYLSTQLTCFATRLGTRCSLQASGIAIYDLCLLDSLGCGVNSYQLSCLSFSQSLAGRGTSLTTGKGHCGATVEAGLLTLA